MNSSRSAASGSARSSRPHSARLVGRAEGGEVAASVIARDGSILTAAVALLAWFAWTAMSRGAGCAFEPRRRGGGGSAARTGHGRRALDLLRRRLGGRLRRFADRAAVRGTVQLHRRSLRDRVRRCAARVRAWRALAAIDSAVGPRRGGGASQSWRLTPRAT